ncbi:hypothetical protein ED733_004806 [Metarhizium rileyi]|uniref:Uncharacterized protein n=1 Tax=Metarhizium rileyi (strain RCEF 4871) TaxID=1649241 RepID=A0A5C6G6G7_METRR|nr:hypothetical protein ED733_004806 [Metarhizium rileyi]
MGRWSHLDSDDEHLPDGVFRVGYDADTQSYTYQDRSGNYWEGNPGQRYGPLRRVQTSPDIQKVPQDDTPHVAPAQERMTSPRYCDALGESIGLLQGGKQDAKDLDLEGAGKSSDKQKMASEKRKLRSLTGSVSKLAGYFRASQIEPTAGHDAREETYSRGQTDTSMSPQGTSVKRAVTFDEILDRVPVVECCTPFDGMKGC